jgi:hypothetical protein
MANVLLKTGEIVQVPIEELEEYLHANEDKIQFQKLKSVRGSVENDMQALDSMIGLVENWLQDESGYDAEVYPLIEAALNQDKFVY